MSPASLAVRSDPLLQRVRGCALRWLRLAALGLLGLHDVRAAFWEAISVTEESSVSWLVVARVSEVHWVSVTFRQRPSWTCRPPPCRYAEGTREAVPFEKYIQRAGRLRRRRKVARQV